MTIPNDNYGIKWLLYVLKNSLDCLISMGIHIKSDKLLYKRLEMAYSSNNSAYNGN